MVFLLLQPRGHLEKEPIFISKYKSSTILRFFLCGNFSFALAAKYVFC